MDIKYISQHGKDANGKMQCVLNIGDKGIYILPWFIIGLMDIKYISQHGKMQTDSYSNLNDQKMDKGYERQKENKMALSINCHASLSFPPI